jgi:DNA primase
MEMERIDYRDAVKYLANQVHFDLSKYEKNPEITEKRQQEREQLKMVNKRAILWISSPDHRQNRIVSIKEN